MTPQTDFPLKLAAIKAAMEREEWGKAIHDLENVGDVPDKFQALALNILFYLYLSRNQYEQLARVSGSLEPAKAKDCVSALLLMRDKALGYPVDLPERWNVAAWEKAMQGHADAGALEARELRLCFFFLSLLNRPHLLERLLRLSVEGGESLDEECVEVVLRCYLRKGMFAEARRFLWLNNLVDIPFDRFNFLIDRMENSATAIPESDDKFIRFLRYKFGSQLPSQVTPCDATT